MEGPTRRKTAIAVCLVFLLGTLAWFEFRESARPAPSVDDQSPAVAAVAPASIDTLVTRRDTAPPPLRANPRPKPADERDMPPLSGGSLLPPASAYGEIETLQENERINPANGVIERVRLVRADFKYPLLRVEESWVLDESKPTPAEVLLKRTVMVADHVLVSRPGAALRDRREYRVLDEIAPGSDTWRVSIPAASLDDMPEAIATLGKSVEIAEPDFLVFHQQVVPNDPAFGELWGMRNTAQTGGTAGADVKATQAWQQGTGGGQIVVAVIDSGVDYLHPDLVDNIHQKSTEALNGTDSDGNGYVDDIRGWDFYGNDNDPMDDHFHGTHVAGSVGARGNNALGVAGVIWNVKIMPLKFLSANGGGTTSDAIAAVRYSADNGARISCNSWGGGGYSRLLEDAIRHADSLGSLFVAAAGNSANNNDVSPSYPASYSLPNIISVAATDHNDEIAWFSNYGADRVHIAAPGVGITSTFPREVTAAMASYGLPAGYARISGTSMATPYVAGAAALLLDSDPAQTSGQLRNRILQRVDFLPGLAGLVSTSGRLNVANLVDSSWSPGPAAPDFNRLSSQEVTGQSDGDGVAEPGERIQILCDISNRGGLEAVGVVVHSEVISGPASLVSTADVPAENLPAHETIRNFPAAVVHIQSSAQDLQPVVIRLGIRWQGGAETTREIRIPVVKLATLQASREVNFSIGEMIRGPSENKVLLLSPSDWRVMEFDTASASFSRHADLDQTGLSLDKPGFKCGGLATNAEGNLLFVALTGTRRIQVFSLPGILPLRTLEVDHEPYSLAVDAQGRLFTTSMDYWGPLRQVDADNGRTLAARNLSNLGRKVFQGALLEMNSARTRLFLAETGLWVTGGPGEVHEWDVAGQAMDLIARHPNFTVYLNDFAVDEENSQLFTMHGGIYGVQVTSLSTGAYGNVWPLRSPYGMAVDVPPGREYFFAGSGSPHDGVIRRYQKATGQDLGAFAVQPAGTGAPLMPRGLVTTSNDRVFYVSTRATGSLSVGIDATLYFLNLTGASSINVSLPPRLPLPAQPMLAKVDFSDFGGNGNAIPNPGENIHLTPFLRNVGEAPTAAGFLEIESLDARVTITGSNHWDVAPMNGRTTIMLPQVAVRIGEDVPGGTAVDFRFRLTLGGGAEVHDFSHRLVVVQPVVPPVNRTTPFTYSSLQFSGMAANPNLNEVYLVDCRLMRVLVLDTTYGMVRRIEPLPLDSPLLNGKPVKLGEPAVSPDGSLLAVAGNETNRVFVFSLPELKAVATHQTTFRPTHVAFDAMNRLHVTGTNKPAGTTLKTLRMDAISGAGQMQYGDDVAGSPLRASKNGSVVGRFENGSLRLYDGTTETPALLWNIPMSGQVLYDFEIDPASGRLLMIFRDGAVTVRNLVGGDVTSWPLSQPWSGSSVRLCPNGEIVAASDAWYGGGVRRYSAAGATLDDVLVTDYGNTSGGNGGEIIPRGLAVTPNGRVAFLARRLVPQSISVDGYDYTVGIIDLPVNLAEPTPRALRLTNLQLLDPAPANGNGFAEPGETIRIVPSLLNTGFTLLENVTLRLVSTNPAVVPLEPLEAVFPAVASGITFSPSSSGLAAALDPSLRDGEPLGLSLQVTHDAGSQFIPLDLFAVKSTRADAELNFVPGAMLADTTRDVVYVSDTTNNRILSIDTNSGTVLAGGPLAGVIGRGDIALSADGGSIAVALFESSRVHILSSTTLASREVLHLNFKPVSVAFGANGRLYASNGVTSSRLSEFDPERGTWTFIGSKFHRSSNQLRSSIDRSRLFVCEVGYSGTSIAVDEYSVAGDTSSAVARPHFYKGTGATGDIALDEAQDRFFAAMAATHGLQVTALRRGLTEGVWPFAADQYHGKGCALTHDGDFIYAGSAAANGMIRRYERWGGRPLADFPLKAPGVSMVFYLIERGIVVTPNQRVLFATRNQSTSLAATRHFLGLLGGDSLNMTIPLARPKVDAGQDRTVKLSKPLTFQPVLELPSGSGTATTTWTKVSGPGAVVTSTQGGMTTVNFSQPGRYQMQFAATVDGATSTDSVWVDVQPDDPWVNLTATSAKAMRHPGLFGGFVLSREGDPSMPLTVQLQSAGTAVAGTDYIALPSSVVMAAGVRSVDIPLVLLPGEGAGSVALSVLRGTAYEPGSSASATITIAPASLANWLEAVRDARPELDFSALGDANGNGLSNLMEYLLGRDPLIPSHVHPMATTVEGHPRTVTASYRALKNPVGASLAAEFSNNLFQWHTTWEGAPALTVLHREDHGDGTETITVRLNPAAATEPAGYLRLKAVEAGD